MDCRDEFDFSDDDEWSQEAMREIMTEHFAVGCPIVYEDREYPDQIIEEWPDGRRYIIDLDANYNKIYVRQISTKERGQKRT